MIEPSDSGDESPPALPAPTKLKDGELLIVPLHHIFGSEELSAAAPCIAELAPAPYIALCAEDAHALGVSENQDVVVAVGAVQLRLPLKLRTLPRGVAGLPVGLPAMQYLELPRSGILRKGGGHE